MECMEESPIVTTMEKSTRNQSLGNELTHAFQGERSTRTLGQFLTISTKYYSVCSHNLATYPYLVTNNKKDKHR